MKTDYLKFFVLSSFILIITWTISCSGRSGRTKATETGKSQPVATVQPAAAIRMNSPATDAEYKLKDQIKVSVSPDSEKNVFDSVKVSFEGKELPVLKSSPWECIIPSSFTSTTGRKSVKAAAYSKGRVQTVTHFVIIYSDIVPKKYGYTVVHTYPHDPQAFTQGLFYDKGMLYEGTGEEAGSSLREVDLATGRVLRQHNLDPSLFGEGITLYKGSIYQVTWRNKVGFVYDESTFDQINKIYYQTEGWGLTTINDRIVMSDGTNVLYFFEPELFTVVSRIEVYDNNKKVDQLNELEYINGEIWANIWQTDRIARIDPVTGRVNSYVDLSGIFPESERKATDADVLNGIAFDAAHNRIFVTGKRWPKLYEITVRE